MDKKDKKKEGANVVTIDEHFKIRMIANCYALVEDDKRSSETYHNTLKSVMKTLLEKKSKRCDTLEEILELYERANALIEGLYGTIFESLEYKTKVKELIIDTVKEAKKKGEL
jgi:hypothetical protein